MFKVFVAVAVLSVAVFAGHGSPPTAAEQEAALVAAGVSQTAAAGLVAIDQKYQSQFQSANGDRTAIQTAIAAVQAEQQTYISTQSTADQTAFAAFVAQREAEHKNHSHGTTPAGK